MDFVEALIERISETVHSRLTMKFFEALWSTQIMLSDAQEKQITDEVVKKWLDDIQDALFQAEDLLDEIHCEERRLQVESGSRSRSNKIRSFFSSDREGRIKDLVENLKGIFRKIEQLGENGPRILAHCYSGYDRRDNSNNLSNMKSRYRELPSSYKRCFLYCALFPKNYFFEKEELVLLWLSNGFLEHPSGGPKIKIQGYFCFNELERSFFVKSSDHPSSFKITDLIYDWAKLLSRNYSVSHLWCSNMGKYEDLENFVEIDRAQMLRTILPISNESFWKYVDDEKIDSFLSTFKRLRVLRLFNIQELPNSIGTMGHLRYLNLSGAAIKKLPETVCSLFNLQTLILRQCRDLVELPVNIVNLTDLCILDVRGTRLQQLPPHIGKLRKLEMLTDFFVGKEPGCRIEELGELFLQGVLHIRNLQNVSDAREVSEINFWRRSFKELELSWSGSSADDSRLQQEVLDELKPRTANMELLSIIGYGGQEFPSWIRKPTFSNIIDLKLSECQYCSSLPPLGQLEALKTLVVQAFYKLEKVGPEFYGSSSTSDPFPSLKILTFERMLQWREWESYTGVNEGRAFPCLEVLCIRKCPNLTKTLPSHLPSLVELEVTKCQTLELPPPRSPPIDKLVLGDDFHKLLLDPHLQSLAVDSIHSSDSILEEIQKWGYSCTSLQKIEITRSPLKTFPPKLLPALKQLDISRCANLESLCAQHLTSLEELKIRKCPKLKSMPEESLPSSLISLSIQSCPLLERRCQPNTGEDWTKISFIPEILIDGCKINREV